MNKELSPRDYFVQLVSVGPSKISFAYAIEAFDMVQKQFGVIVPEAVQVVLDPNFLAQANERITASLAKAQGEAKPELTPAEAEKYIQQMNLKVKHQQQEWAKDAQQDNAEALENLALATAKGRVENEIRIQTDSTSADV